ncbi:MAG: hypothetical protein HY888_11985 [Deltaproteobacteria bacterium]|nr:hypothetical protein [Deltaproteobacteria bacterium]MDU0458373.1 hypothetical protein [Geobacteraceae bacterium]
MRKFIPIQFFARLLLVVMLTVTVNGVHESVHAMQSDVSASSYQVSDVEVFASHQCPCSPLEQHKEYDGCNSCINCACHAPLIVQQFKIDFNPLVLDLQTSDPFRFLPEVFLTKFIPPQK